MENNKTAAEWLFHQLWDEPKDKFTWYAILEKAKEIEKQQIMELKFQTLIAYGVPLEKAIMFSEQYYNEEYGK